MADRNKPGYMNFADIADRLESGKLNAYDTVYTKDTHEVVFIKEDKSLIRMKCRLDVYESVVVAEYYLNLNTDTYVGQIVGIQNGDWVRLYNVNYADDKFIVKKVGVDEYGQLENKPQINGVTLDGNKTTAQLGIDIPTKFSQLYDDVGYETINHLVENYYSKTEADNLFATQGSVPDELSDLDDIALSNVQNGQILKYNSATQKFENADESGGTINDAYKKFKVANTEIVASGEDTLELVAGANVTLTPDAVNKKITISSSGGGGGSTGDMLKEIYDTNNDGIVNAADEATTLTGLNATVSELNTLDGITSNVQEQLNGKADSSDVPVALSDLSDDANHRLVTDTEKSNWDNKSNVSANPVSTTETLTSIEIDGTAYAIPSGSGDVTDVKVNDTSVVDGQGVANIDLTGYAEKSDIPTVNNPTITIQKNGQNVDTFSLNQTTDKVINIPVPTKTSDLQNDSSFITNTVNNLANYYLKTQTYTQVEVDALIDAAVNGRFRKVNTLPVTGEPNIIYLVPKATPETSNACDEYIWQDNAWELIGSTDIDLSGYVTDEDLGIALADYLTISAFNTAIANYYTKTEVGNLLDGKVDKINGKGLSTNDYDNTAKGIVDGVTNALAGKVDKVNGKGLSTEDYTTTEKNKLAGISTNANKVEASTTNGNIKIDGIETQVYDGSGKVDKVNGKGLSTNDYDNTDKAKVDKIDTTTTSVSGNPLSITGLKSDQLAVNPIITFEPIQAGSGTPSPSNVRAISGYDKVEVLSCGVNIWDEQWELGQYSQTDGSPITTSSNIRSKSTNPIRVSANTKYYLSSPQGVRMFFYDSNFEYLSNQGSGSATSFEFTTPANTAFIRFHVSGTYGTTYNNNISITCPSSQTSYNPYHKTTDLSESLGQTVYWGELDVRSGKFKVIGQYVDLSELSWVLYQGSIYQSSDLQTLKKGGRTNFISDRYEAVNVDSVANLGSNQMCGNRTTGVIYVGSTTPTGYAVYELATPFYIQLTPHEISLLSQYAYVSTNGTTITLDYHNGEMASLGDVKQLSETVALLDRPPVRNVQADITNCTTAATQYTTPYDGFVTIYGGTGTSGTVRVIIYDSLSQTMGTLTLTVSEANQQNTTFVKKGMNLRVTANTIAGSYITYRGMA